MVDTNEILGKILDAKYIQYIATDGMIVNLVADGINYGFTIEALDNYKPLNDNQGNIKNYILREVNMLRRDKYLAQEKDTKITAVLGIIALAAFILLVVL